MTDTMIGDFWLGNRRSRQLPTWSVADFKALAHVRVDSVPLTVLTGPNSSGKSSVLQSLLLLGQSSAATSPLVLNGQLVRLGLPDDVIRDRQQSIQIEMDVLADGHASDESQTRIGVSVGRSSDSTTLEPVAFEVVDLRSGQTLFAATSARVAASDHQSIADELGEGVTTLRVTTEQGRRAHSRLYIVFRGLTPLCLVAHKNQNSIDKLYRSALQAAVARAADIAPRFTQGFMSELSALVDRETFLSKNAVAAEGRQGGPQSRRRWSSRDFIDLSSDQVSALLDEALVARGNRELIYVPLDTFRFTRGIAGLMREGIVEAAVAAEHEAGLAVIALYGEQLSQLSLSMRYLGPLRDEPKVVHSSWDERVPTLPVGMRGELTAEVLARRQHEEIEHWDWNGVRRQESLSAAVTRWCEYLGIGESINVIDHGKLGRGLQLKVNGANRDLTTIGVGASQLLPVVVASLSISSGSLFLVEQPELHLHPAVQSRLGDFFLFARPDVHFIVETHSEYLVTRLRRRVAEERVRPSGVQMLFAEQLDGATNIRRLTIDEVGDFEEWPAGFFDAQASDSVEIVRAVRSRLSAGVKL